MASTRFVLIDEEAITGFIKMEFDADAGSKYCDLKLCCAVWEEMNRRIIAEGRQSSSRVTKT